MGEEQIFAKQKLPHESSTIQLTTIQGALMFLLHYYFPSIDPNVFIAWGIISTCALRFISKDAVVWYGHKK